MGTWGTSVDANDTFLNVKSLFLDLFNQGYETQEITKELKNVFECYVSEGEDIINHNHFWFGLAYSHWLIGELEKQLFFKIKSIILSLNDLDYWEGDNVQILERKKELNFFLTLIENKKDKPFKRNSDYALKKK